MSNADQVAFRYQEEVTYGTLAGGNGVALRLTSESIVPDQPTVRSQEINSTRETTSIQQVGNDPSGSVGGELPYGAFDDFLDWLLYSTGWQAPASAVTATDISAAAADNSINSAGSGFSTGWAGRWLKISGFTGTTGNNGIVYCVSATTAKLVVSGITLVNDSAGESVTVKASSYVANGTTQTSFSFEKAFGDLSNEFHVVTGCVLESATLNLALRNLVSATFNVQAKNYTPYTSTQMGTPTAAPTTDSINTRSHVPKIFVGGRATANIGKARDISIAMANNLRRRENIGDTSAESMGAGQFAVSGTFQSYFTASSAVLSVFQANTYTSLAIVLQDDAGNIYVIDLPSIKWSRCANVANALNSDVINDCSFEARKHPTEGFTVRIHRIAA